MSNSNTVHNILLFLPSLETGTSLTKEDRKELFKLLINNAEHNEGLIILPAAKGYFEHDFAGFAECVREYFDNRPNADVEILLKSLDDPRIQDHTVLSWFTTIKSGLDQISLVLILPMLEHFRPKVLDRVGANPLALSELWRILVLDDDPP